MNRFPFHICNNALRTILLTLLNLAAVLSVRAQPAAGWIHTQELYKCLNTLSDSIYIQDRGALDELYGSTCTQTDVRYHASTKKGELIQISIKSKPFVASLHQIKLTDTAYISAHGKKKVDSIFTTNQIDHVQAHGIHGSIPKTELSTFVIVRNNKMLQFPKQFYTDFYNVVLCEKTRAPEVYVTPDGEHLYIYMHGGDNTTSYTVKFVFDRTHFITRIVNTHPCLRDFDFIDGFGECQ